MERWFKGKESLEVMKDLVKEKKSVTPSYSGLNLVNPIQEKYQRRKDIIHRLAVETAAVLPQR